MAGNQTKIAVFTRSKHQAVGSESHWLIEAIGRLVMNFERDQRNPNPLQGDAFGPPLPTDTPN
jgi:hypothetical protein